MLLEKSQKKESWCSWDSTGRVHRLTDNEGMTCLRVAPVLSNRTRQLGRWGHAGHCHRRVDPPRVCGRLHRTRTLVDLWLARVLHFTNSKRPKINLTLTRHILYRMLKSRPWSPLFIQLFVHCNGCAMFHHDHQIFSNNCPLRWWLSRCFVQLLVAGDFAQVYTWWLFLDPVIVL